MLRDIAGRQDKILEIIVSSYVDTAMPVGSRFVSKKLGLSSATIRNIMADLEESGYITHPHTSAGRIPTDKGYRWHVETLKRAREVSKKEAQVINEEYKLRKKSIEDIIKNTAHILSEITHQTGMVLFPKTPKTTFKRIDLIYTSRKKVLVVLVTSTGMVEHFIIETMKELKNDLEKIANLLNSEYYGMSLKDIKGSLINHLKEEKDSLGLVLEEASGIVESLLDSFYSEAVYLEGASRLLAQPEFGDAKAVRPLLEFFERKKMLLELMEKDLKVDGLRVYIGKENKCSRIQNCSIVTVGYKIRDELAGRLGIIGPTRMEYSHMIPLVNHTAMALTKLLNELVE
ncbi:MAG: heat-inducible transcription repressor HrcA [Candidatus Omnitrophica bacterium]|nr:heat-inducible transcription repressor HrcA [Candidatus Omnitrophota bacterium]